jgi:predicted dehydrogenase
MTAGAGQARTVAVLGVGRFGALHARVWREAGARLVGFGDVDTARLATVAERFAVPEVDTDPRRLLDRVGPDAVVVASDEASHVELTLLALQTGCHVFVEKPLALSGTDAWRVHDAAARAGRQVVAGQISRFAPPYARIREGISAGRVGRLCALRLRRDFSRSWFLSFGERVHPVWESCVHDIDLAVWFVGRPVRRVVAMQSGAAGNAAAGVVAALLEFDDGVIATVESAWLVPDSAPQTVSGALELAGSIVGEGEVLGLDGVLRQRLVNDALVEWTREGVRVPDLSLWPEEDGMVGGALRREVDYALAVFSGKRPHDVVPLQQVCWGVQAAEAVVVSLATGKPVDVPEPASTAGMGRLR